MNESKIIKVVDCTGTPYEIGLQYGKTSEAILRKSHGMCLNTLTGFAKVTMNADLSTDEILRYGIHPKGNLIWTMQKFR